MNYEILVWTELKFDPIQACKENSMFFVVLVILICYSLSKMYELIK